MKPRKYTPRRANVARWLQDAPEYVLDCFDDSKRYPNDGITVILGKQFMEWCEHRGTHYLSCICMNRSGHYASDQMAAHTAAAFRYSNGRHRVRWNDLPEAVRQSVIRWATMPV